VVCHQDTGHHNGSFIYHATCCHQGRVLCVIRAADAGRIGDRVTPHGCGKDKVSHTSKIQQELRLEGMYLVELMLTLILQDEN
jgi:hypothetical protein